MGRESCVSADARVGRGCFVKVRAATAHEPLTRRRPNPDRDGPDYKAGALGTERVRS